MKGHFCFKESTAYLVHQSATNPAFFQIVDTQTFNKQLKPAPWSLFGLKDSNCSSSSKWKKIGSRMKLHGVDPDEIGAVAVPLQTLEELACLVISLNDSVTSANGILIRTIPGDNQRTIEKSNRDIILPRSKVYVHSTKNINY